MGRLLPIAWAVVLLAGCGTARPLDEGRRSCVSWREDLGPRFAVRCAACHGGEVPAGGYSVGDYSAAIGLGRGKGPVASAGRADSRLLEVLDPALADEVHRDVSDLFEPTRQWVVDCELSYFRSAVHEGGILDPSSPAFHGRAIAEAAWSFQPCQDCHGQDFAGGKAGVSCLTCHPAPDGPIGCTTCHGQPPASGSHRAHAERGALGKRYACTQCHLQPSLYSDAGHLLRADGSVDPAPAEVIFGGLALVGTASGSAPPSWNGVSCSNVYCHGGGRADAKALVPSPTWGEPGAAICGGCHGLPPAGHPGGACISCHPRVVDGAGALRDLSLHLDGQLSLGDDSGSCQACHPIGAGLSGAHDSHTGATHRLAAPIGCGECHDLPASVSSPGHLTADGKPVVFPAGAGPASSAYGAAPSWDASARRCADTHCHGGGSKLGADLSPSILRTPSFVPGSGPAACGACHGLPPSDQLHDPRWSLTTCGVCHPSTIDTTGQLLVGPAGSTHVNGVVDVRP